MSKTAMLHARMEPKLKKSAEAILQTLGLSTTEAITLFLHQVVLNEGLPFEVKVPSAKTQKAMRNVLLGKNMKSFKSVEALKRGLDKC